MTDSSNNEIPTTEKSEVIEQDRNAEVHPSTLGESQASEAIPIAKSNSKQTTPDPFPYRHYYALYPTCNKMLASKWDAAQRHRHLKKLAAAKPNVDNTAPKVYNHLKVKLKKIQMEEGI